MACIPSFLLYPGKSQVCILYICQNLHMFPEDSSLRKKGKNMSQSTYANCKLTREMMIHLQNLQRLTTTFGISHD